MSRITHSTLSHSRNTETRRSILAGAGDRLVTLFDRMATWSERRRQRLALESLPDHLLADIGVSRADASQETEKPFWRG